MSKLLVIFGILCTILVQQSNSASISLPTHSKPANFTRNFQSNGPNTAIVYLEISDYLSVTIDGNVLSINHLFKRGGNKLEPPCKLIIDPFEDGILGRINAIGFKQSIVVWGIRSVDEIDEIKHTIYTMLLVDPLKCKYRPLKLPSDRVPIVYPTIPPQVQIAPHEKHGLAFYIFYQTLKRCAPCQYFPKDLEITDVEYQIKEPIMEPSKALNIKPFGELASQVNNGYFLAYNYAIGTTRLEYLSKNFTTLARRYLNHTVDTTSIVLSSADRQNVAACWKHNVDHITCERYDSRLYSTVSYHVRGDTASILFDMYENAYISTATKLGGVMLRIYNVFGQLIDELDFGIVGRSAQQLEVYGFLEDFDNPHDYCLVVMEYQRILGNEVNYSVRCIDVRKYTKFA